MIIIHHNQKQLYHKQFQELRFKDNMKKKYFALLIIFFVCSTGYSQKQDTLLINPSNVNTKALMPGIHRYLIYFKMGKDSGRTNYQLWSRNIDYISIKGVNAISVTQEWEDNDTVFHKAHSILNKKDFSTIYHKSWWKATGAWVTYDFEKKEILLSGNSLREKKDSISVKRVAAFDASTLQYCLNWHLDLEVFSLLPYKEGITFKINFYDPGSEAPRYTYYTVSGSDSLAIYNNQKIDCWLLTHGSLPENFETFWISKKTKEVLKLEQEYSGKFRYKIKLGYSD